jgi:hypothetical protein
VLVHEWAGRRPGDREGMYGTAHHITSRPPTDKPEPGLEQHHVLPDTELDEVVIGSWLHLEQMDVGQWWLNVGGVTVWVTADRDGRPTSVSMFGPHDYDGPREGVTYVCEWTDPEPPPAAPYWEADEVPPATTTGEVL